MSTKYIYQPPLTHKVQGPGLILVLSESTSPGHASPRLSHLDPLPVQKWAEEGFCVLAIVVAKDEQRTDDKDSQYTLLDWRQIVLRGIEELHRKEELIGKSLGLIVYESTKAEEVLSSVSSLPEICCVATYVDWEHASHVRNVTCPLLRHVGVLNSNVVEAGQPLVQDSADIHDPAALVTTYRYIQPSASPTPKASAKLSMPPASAFIYPASPNYNHTYATLAHTRTLTFLRSHIGGPIFDIEAIWETHTRFEFEGRDVEGTMATMVAEPYVNHIPTLTGGIGRPALTLFYARHFIHSNPTSTRMELVSRTIGPDRIVDEFIFEFVHDMEIDWMLPGVPPTGKHVRVPFVAVVNVRGDKLYHEHIYWDQASVLVQIGLLPRTLAFPGTTEEIKLPVVGAEQANKMLDPVAVPSNLLIKGRVQTDEKTD